MATNKPLFQGPKLKIERAKRHISELETEISAFIARDPYSIVIERNEDAGRVNSVIRVREDVPDSWATIIGDAIHNLRGALDLLACDLVMLNGKSTKGVYFPFAETGNDFESMIKKRNIDRASPDVVDIMRSFKPYKGGNESLRAIHDLDIADKHKALIPVSHYTGTPDMKIVRNGEVIGNATDCGFGPIRDGSVAVSVSLDMQIIVDQNTKPTFHITFDYGLPLQFKPIVPTLHQLTNLVDGIINIFHKHLQP